MQEGLTDIDLLTEEILTDEQRAVTLLMAIIPVANWSAIRNGAKAGNILTEAMRVSTKSDEIVNAVSVAIKAPTNKGGLRDAVKKVSPKPFDNAHVHHGLPWKFKDDFAKYGFNVNDIKWGAWVEGGKGKGKHLSWSKAYEEEWKIYFDELEKRIEKDKDVDYNQIQKEIEDFYDKIRKKRKYGGGF